MCIAAARELDKVAEDKGPSEEHIIPNMDEWEVVPSANQPGSELTNI